MYIMICKHEKSCKQIYRLNSSNHSNNCMWSTFIIRCISFMGGNIMIRQPNNNIEEENSILYGTLVIICAIIVGFICFYI